jgi:hypothetical protein
MDAEENTWTKEGWSEGMMEEQLNEELHELC